MTFSSKITRRAVAGLVVLPLLAGPALAEKLSLNAISRYLNGMKTVQAPFTQINADGTISTGSIAISRPGKARFDYDPPERALVLVSAGAVYILDRKTGASPETYPLNQTPLSIILARKVDLSTAGMLKAHGFDGTATTITAQDPKRPEYGSIQLKFTGNPVELRQWIITDGDGNKTTVILGGLEQVNLPLSTFLIDNALE